MPDLIQRPPPPDEYLEPIEQVYDQVYEEAYEKAPWDELLNKLLSDYKAIQDLLPSENHEDVSATISMLIWDASTPFINPCLKPAKITRYLDSVREATSEAPLHIEILAQLDVFRTTLEAYLEWVDTVENVITLSEYVGDILDKYNNKITK